MFDWHSFYELARGLCPASIETELDKARCRSSISRAYYSALSLSRRYIIQTDGSVTRNELRNHGYICNYFANLDSSVENNITLTTNLQKLMRNRRRADYDDDYIERLHLMTRRSLRLNDRITELFDGL